MSTTIVHPGRSGASDRTMFGYTSKTHPRLDRVQNAVSAVCGTLAGVAALAIVVLTLAGVVTRNFLNEPLGWSVGLIELYLLPIAAFFGAVTAYRSGAHIAVYTVFNRFPVTARKCILVLSHIIVFIGFSAMAWGGFHAAVFAFETNQGPIPGSSLLLIPGWVMESIVPIATSLGAIVVAIDVYRELFSDWSTTTTDYDPGDAEIEELASVNSEAARTTESESTTGDEGDRR